MSKYRVDSLLSPNFIFAVIVVLFTVLTYFHDLTKMIINERSFSDFGAYYFFAKHTRPHYDVSVLDQDQEKKQKLKEELGIEVLHSSGYQPLFYYLMKPFTLMEYKYAKILWALLIHLLLFISLAFIVRLTNSTYDYPSIAVIVFMTFCFQPLRETVALGNTDLVILFFLTLCIYFSSNGSSALSGIFLALGAFIKYSYGLLFLFFLWKREYRVFFSALTTFLSLKIISIFVLGLDVQLAYLRVIDEMFFGGMYTLGIHSQSLRTLLYRLIGNKDLSTTVSLALSVMILSSTLIISRRKENIHDFFLEFSFWITTLFLVSPYVSLGHYTILYLPLFFVWSYLKEEKRLSYWFMYL